MRWCQYHGVAHEWGMDCGAILAEDSTDTEITRLRQALDRAEKCLRTIAFGPWRDFGLENLSNVRDYARDGAIDAHCALLSCKPKQGGEG
jgi:hypothetical protein